MDPSASKPFDPALAQRGQRLAAATRWASFGLGVVSLLLLWDHPRTRPLPCVLLGLAYVAYMLASGAALRRHPKNRALRRAHAFVDALALGLAAAFSGGLDSPIWLILYPHAVAYSVRGGLGFGVVIGALDAVIVLLLSGLTPGQPLGSLHALTLGWCGLMGGLTSAHLQGMQASLLQTARELEDKNHLLSETLSAEAGARAQQEQALARLGRSEERYRRLLARIQDGVVIVQDGRVAYVNEAFAAMTGAAAEALLGVDFRELTPAEEREDLLARYRGWEETQAQAVAFEARLLTRKGERLLVSVRAGSAEWDGRRALIATVRDITRERRMDADLKAHAERLAALNEIASALNTNLTIEDIFAVAAGEARQLVPFDRLTIALLDERGAGLELISVGPRAARRRADFAATEVAWAFKRPTSWCAGLEGRPPARLADLLAAPDVASAATVPLLSTDRVIGSVNLGRLEPAPFSAWDLAVLEPVARQIAIALDNARLLEALRRRTREFESLFGVGRAIVERLDLGELLPLVTHSVNRLMATDACLLLLREGDELQLGAQQGLEPDLARALQGPRPPDDLTARVAREGEPLMVLDLGDDPRFAHGERTARFGYRSHLGVPLMRGEEVLGTLEVMTRQPRRFGPAERDLLAAMAGAAAVGIENARLFEQQRRDVATLEEANRRLADVNRRLEELDRLRREYLRNVSHEFRTPLTVIKGYAEYLMDAGAPDQRALSEVMRVITESCDRVIDLVDTLIEVSRVEQGMGRQTLQVQRLDLRDVAAGSVELLRAAATKKGIHVELQMPAEPLELYGDSGLLQQVVRKLVDNAVKYSPSGSRVAVRGWGEGERLALEVEDHGIGIAPEHLPRIFEKFYMVDGGIARRVGGTGVGLYLVREIVRLHDGAVDVRSVPGTGSVFSVRLPRRPQPAEPPSVEA